MIFEISVVLLSDSYSRQTNKGIDLKDKTFIVTGGTAGLGYHAVKVWGKSYTVKQPVT